MIKIKPKSIAYNRLKGFTLAEVLVTISIIGVVAAVTIPSLIQNTNDSEYKVAWKKAYSDIDQTIQEIVFDNAGSLKGAFTSKEVMRDLFMDKLSYISSCSTTDAENKCWHSGSKWYFLNGNATGVTTFSPGLKLNNGVLIRFYGVSSTCAGTFNTCSDLTIDVNGFKAPNRIGKDIFYIHVHEDHISPWGMPGDGKSCDSSGQGCGAAYLKG